MGYRLSTAIFALLFAFMVVKDLNRPEPARPTIPDAAPETVPPAASPDPVVGTGPEPERAAERPDEAIAKAPETAAAPPERALDLTSRLLFRRAGALYRSDWPGVLKQLEPRKEEVAPVLEDWLRRGDKLWKEGIYLQNVPRAYAELVGADALPLLVSLIENRAGPWAAAARALCRIDDPEAVEIVRRNQESQPPRAWFVGGDDLWYGAPAFRDLCREWMVSPPAGHPWVADEMRKRFFRRGTNKEREAVWALFDRRQRVEKLLGGLARHWGGPWPERFRDGVTNGLADIDPWLRYFAANRVVLERGHVAESLLSLAERTLEDDIARGDSGEEAPKMSMLMSTLAKLRSWRAEKEAARRKRELLTPR